MRRDDQLADRRTIRLRDGPLRDRDFVEYRADSPCAPRSTQLALVPDWPTFACEVGSMQHLVELVRWGAGLSSCLRWPSGPWPTTWSASRSRRSFDGTSAPWSPGVAHRSAPPEHSSISSISKPHDPPEGRQELDWRAIRGSAGGERCTRPRLGRGGRRSHHLDAHRFEPRPSTARLRTSKATARRDATRSTSACCLASPVSSDLCVPRDERRD